MSTKTGRYRGLKPQQPLPSGVSYTKPIRFTLPTELAEKLESMPKRERDQLVRDALQARQ